MSARITVPTGPACDHHDIHWVRAGDFQVGLTGSQYWPPAPSILPESEVDLFFPLNGSQPFGAAGRQAIDTRLQLPDFGGVPSNWQQLLEDFVIADLKDGAKVVAFCTASHGRTGAFLASLIALLESRDETPDPISAARERHCSHAVETRAQAIGIFALRGQPVPSHHQFRY